MNQKEYYKILTDNENYWISESELIKATIGIPTSKLAMFDLELDNKVVKGEIYYKIGKDLLYFIRDNTNNPRRYPIATLIETKENKKTVQKEDNKNKTR